MQIKIVAKIFIAYTLHDMRGLCKKWGQSTLYAKRDIPFRHVVAAGIRNGRTYCATPINRLTACLRTPSARFYQTKKTSHITGLFSLVGDIGFEPITSTTSMWRSSQMS